MTPDAGAAEASHSMPKTCPIVGIGDGAGVLLDTELLALAGVRIGDQLAAAVDERGAIVLTPLRPVIGGQAQAPVVGGGPPNTLREAS